MDLLEKKEVVLLDSFMICIAVAVAKTRLVMMMRSPSVNWYRVSPVHPLKSKYHAQLGVSNPSCKNIVFGD
jgi:hypothetical protein